jgi:hypothetical protein
MRTDVPKTLQFDSELLLENPSIRLESKELSFSENQRTILAKDEQLIEWEDVPNELQLNYNPSSTTIPTCPDYEPDSQSIIVNTDWVWRVKPSVLGTNQERVILQLYT